MSEIITRYIDMDRTLLDEHQIVVCDSSSIRCKNLEELQKILQNESGSVIIMPEEDLKESSSGYAKAQILSSLPGVVAIISSPELSVKRILEGEEGPFRQIGRVTFSEETIYDSSNIQKEIEIPITTSQEDIDFMKMTNDLIPGSNCWWKPNGCIVVKDSNLIVSAVSTNPWCTNCTALHLNSSDLNLKKGERLDFCDSIHAERLVVSKAAKSGKSLEGSKVYVTSCPCEECAKVLIYSGVNTVIFGNDSYGLKDAYLLTDNGIKLFRVKS